MNERNNDDKSKDIKKLYLSSSHKKIAGVCGGMAEYFEIDPTVVRLAWVIVTLTSGVIPGIITYIIAIFMIPKEHTALASTMLKPKHAL